jgi:hypothetical protein
MSKTSDALLNNKKHCNQQRLHYVRIISAQLLLKVFSSLLSLWSLFDQIVMGEKPTQTVLLNLTAAAQTVNEHVLNFDS